MDSQVRLVERRGPQQVTGCKALAGPPLAGSYSPTPQRPGEDLEPGGAQQELVEPAHVHHDFGVPPAEEEDPKIEDDVPLRRPPLWPLLPYPASIKTTFKGGFLPQPKSTLLYPRSRTRTKTTVPY